MPTDTAAEAAETPGDPGPDAQAENATDAPVGDAGKRAIEAEREARREAEKQRNILAAKVKEYEADSGKAATLQQQLEEMVSKVAEAEAKAATAAAEATKLRVAQELGLPQILVQFLDGSDEKLAREQGEALKAAMAPDASARRAPAPDPSQGAKPAQTTEQELDALIAEAVKAGDHATSIRLKRQKAALSAS